MSDTPGISIAVMKLPVHARSTATPRPRRFASAARETTASSIGGVLPSPFTISATLAPGFSSRSVTIESSSDATISSAPSIVVRSTPFSPWMPRPNSISFSPSPKPGLHRRHRAGAQCHAHRAKRRRRAARDPGDVGERPAALGRRSGKLVHEHRAGNAAPAVARHQVAQRHVVGYDHHLDGDALLAGEFGGEAEVQPVAGVVLDDEHCAGLAADSEDRGKHRIGAGRGEDIAGDGRR